MLVTLLLSLQKVKNFKAQINREFRISHDALYNVYQLCFQLKFNNRKGQEKDFITQLSLHPRILLHLMANPLLSALEQLLKLCTEPVILHYDTLFNVGDYYLSTLSFRHKLFVGDPIIPVAFLIHSRRYHSDHVEFFQSITNVIKTLLSKQVNIVTDREFKLHNIFPIVNHIFCWNHIENDLHWYLKNNCNSTPEDLNYFVNIWKDLVRNDMEVDFDREWEMLQNNNNFLSKPKVSDYFKNNLIPSFKAHSAIWILKAAGIPNPGNGITNNPSESMNAVLKRLKYWKQVPLDAITVSLYQLCMYYYREIERSIHQCGQWEVKNKFDHFRREPSFLPKLPPVLNPKEIVDKLLKDMKKSPIATNIEEADENPYPTNSINVLQ